MVSLFASEALLPEGWAAGVRIEIEGVRIVRVDRGVSPTPADERQDVVLPAIANVHGHAFQRAMAGLAERRGTGADTFWTWRETMYRFALAMTPDDLEAVAAYLYAELLEGGFTRVGEFHYLHHDPDGQPYGNIAEMTERIAAASAAAGIGLTLLPVFYAHSGFGAAPPTSGQRRFVSDLEGFARLMERCERLAAGLPGAVPGVAPHSLRAATLDELRAVVPLARGGPVHIHVAEQVREVEDCVAASGRRPVELLLAECPVDAHWCLVHATHMTAAETRELARSGAIAGLCPTTEANLGDGVFPASAFLDAGGRFGIGTDSNIVTSAPAELRQLEYAQRLAGRARNVVAEPGGSTGRSLLTRALAGGAAATGVTMGIAAGGLADLVALDRKGSEYLSGDDLLDTWVFGSGVRIDGVWAMGRKQVVAGRHVARDRIAGRFAATMRRLLSA